MFLFSGYFLNFALEDFVEQERVKCQQLYTPHTYFLNVICAELLLM